MDVSRADPMIINDSRADTIFAVSSGLGKAAVAVVRVSGAQCPEIAARICRRASLPDRTATLAPLYNEAGELLDRAIALRFHAPRSFTGEDMIEFQVTGSRAVVNGLTRTLGAISGVRPAEAGEFALRAFQNGKLDLLEVEGLASVVDAETNAQLRVALSMANGALTRQCERIRERLIRAMSVVESLLDFSDVEDASEYGVEDALPFVQDAAALVGALLDNSGVYQRLREGLNVVIAGPPNAGKSTLLNHLAQRDVAIVSEFPGTTRDSLEISTEIAGFPVVFTDTAGIRNAEDPVEIQGVARSRERIANADLVLWLSDMGDCEPPAGLPPGALIQVRTKADRPSSWEARAEMMEISAKTGAGVAELIAKVAEFARGHFQGYENVAIGTERQRAAFRDVASALQAILHEPNAPLEGVAEELRAADAALGRVVGRIGVDEVFDDIFSRLCVGK